MSKARYRRGRLYAADMAQYARAISERENNTNDIHELRKSLAAALKEDITEKQRNYLTLYYGEGMNMREIGKQMGVDKSTVSRTIKRGEARLRRCLRYGAKRLMVQEDI